MCANRREEQVSSHSIIAIQTLAFVNRVKQRLRGLGWEPLAEINLDPYTLDHGAFHLMSRLRERSEQSSDVRLEPYPLVLVVLLKESDFASRGVRCLGWNRTLT